MAGFKGHIATSASLGVVYGGWGWSQLQLEWGPVCLAGVLATLGGMLPDLDSDSSVPVREMFNLAGALGPILFLSRLEAAHYTPDQILVILAGIYLIVRFGLSHLFKRMSVHRGMFHSVPAMLIAGLAVFLVYHNPNIHRRAYMAGGIMLGFLSHLFLDELFAVDLMGLTPKLNKYAGSALKFWSSSWSATLTTYLILALLAVPAWSLWTTR